MTNTNKHNDAIDTSKTHMSHEAMRHMSHEAIADELMSAMSSIWANPRYRSDKKKAWRAVESWKNIINLHIIQTTDTYELNVLYAFLNAVTYHIYDLSADDAQRFINQVIETMKEV